jgi:hypothetical protein
MYALLIMRVDVEVRGVRANCATERVGASTGK